MKAAMKLAPGSGLVTKSMYALRRAGVVRKRSVEKEGVSIGSGVASGVASWVFKIEEIFILEVDGASDEG